MKKSILYTSLALLTLIYSPVLFAQNVTYSSFSKAKNTLLSKVYTDYFKTVYCDADFNAKSKKIVKYPDGFDDTVMANRSKRIEFEHIVPAENFGRSFKEWREGHPLCVSKNKIYKGRKCAEKTNITYQLMQADMYNLYPAIGSVNGLRSNKQYLVLPSNIPSSFGSCHFKIADNKAEPPENAKGIVGRTHLYFEEVYFPRFKLSNRQRYIMVDWHMKHPVTQWECTRTYRIEMLQGSENSITKQACINAGLWPVQHDTVKRKK